MPKLSMFNFVTLDGCFKGFNEDISWHNFGEDEQKMSDELSNQNHTLIFGRVTYNMMHSYWSSSEALKNDPITASGMNKAKKIVVSRTLKSVDWQNTRLIQSDLISEIQKMKNQEGPDLVVLGSGQIVAQLADASLFDEYKFMINPVVMGEGVSLFKGLTRQLKLKLKSVKQMKSGNVLLNYST